INIAGLDDSVFASKVIADSEIILQRAIQMEAEILAFVEAKI
ncbi:MAG: hypothetical protein RIQ78_1370, partial [Bacteroidota bacterium]